MSDNELPPLPTPEFLLKWVDGSEYRVTRPNVGDTDVFTADQMREYARAVERAAYERAAQLVKPKSPRPCDCDACDCGNSGDLSAVIQWDAATMLVDAIRALGRQHD